MLKGSPPLVAASLGAFGGAAGNAASGNAEERAFVRVMSPPHPPKGGLSPHPPQGGAPREVELFALCVKKKRSQMRALLSTDSKAAQDPLICIEVGADTFRCALPEVVAHLRRHLHDST